MIRRFTREDMADARRLLRDAIRLEPDSSVPYCVAAFTYYFDLDRGWSDAESESLDKLAKLAQRSLELGDVSGLGAMALALFHLQQRQYEESLRLSADALEGRPSCQAAYSSRANMVSLCGRPEEAIAPAKYVIRLSPIVATFYPSVLATSYYLLERHDEALGAADQAFVLAPDNPQDPRRAGDRRPLDEDEVDTALPALLQFSGPPRR